MRLIVSLFLCLPLLQAEPLEQRVRGLIGSSVSAMRTAWGIEAVRLQTGEPLVRIEPDRYFIPASNTKLFSTALALIRLGPGYRFHTLVTAHCEPDGAGVLRSDLRFVGGGDPTLSGRPVPYRKDAQEGNPLQAIEDLAEQIASRGVRRLEGDIVGDDTRYVWAPYPPGWANDDAVWDYGAPVSALTLNDNLVAISLQPRAPGLPASLSLSPALEYFTIDNRVRSTASGERRIEVDRPAGSRQLSIWGTLPARPGVYRVLAAFDDPALYAARALADALGRRGVEIRGRAVARHQTANEIPDLKGPAPLVLPRSPEIELARRASPELIEVLRIVHKVSQNLHAEMVLRETAFVRRGIGSREAALDDLREFLTETGIEEAEYRFEDGSGLSRLNLVTPAVVVKLLRRLYDSPYRDAWISLLPVGGLDGTLDKRFDRHPLAARIHAKTGSLSHVNALSGYADSERWGPVAFSIFANNSNAPSAEIRAIIDKIALAIAE